MAPTGARVHTIPPLVYLVPLAAAWAVDRFVPLRLPHWPGLDALGAVLVAGGAMLMGWAVLDLVRVHTTVIPWEEVRRLVTTGPFGHTRNPIYLADTVVYLGLTLLLGTWWPVLALPFVLLAMDRLVISREEEYLAARFGADYAAYRSRVRRWL